jgi:hypothetical protein
MTTVNDHRTPQEASNVVRQSDDVFLWRYLMFAICCEIALATLTYVERVVPGSLLLALYLFALVVLATIVVLLIGIVAMFRQKYRGGAALLLAPLIIVSSFLFSIAGFEDEALELFRFYLNKSQYDATIDELSSVERAAKVVFFQWGTTGSMFAASYHWLVYDESGEIALPDGKRTQAWKDRVSKDKVYVSDDRCLENTYRLSSHYYSMAIHCPF